MGSLLEDIKYQDIHLEEIVGRGSFGVVYRAKWKGQTVAVKRAETETEIQSFQIEVCQLRRVCHPNIITVYGVCADQSTNPLCLIMEYADCGSLYQFLHPGSEKTPQYTCAHAISWLLQCAKGVAYLHAMKPKALIHRDLKPPNILLTEGGRQCKICDFGTACEARTYLTNNRGSAAWMAPEVFESNKYTEKCDVFSFGIIIWEVLTRKRPYDEIGGNIYRIMWAIHKGIRPPQIRGCPVILEKLMSKCWARLPEERPRMLYAVKVLERVLNCLKGTEQPVRWNKSNSNISRLRSIEEGSGATSNEGTLAYDSSAASGKDVNTVLFRGDAKELAKKNDVPIESHTNTLNILPIVAAEPEPYVRYTTLHEHVQQPPYEEEEFLPTSSSSRFSSTVEFNSDDHGFVEYAQPTIRPAGTFRIMTRPTSLDFIRPAHMQQQNFNFSVHPNIQIEMRHTPAVRRVQSLTFNMSPTSTTVPTTVIQRHYSVRSDPDDFSYTEDTTTDDDDTCHSESFPTHTLYAR